MDILLGFLAGALTLLNPCVLPVLPVVLASALGADRRGPLFLTLGMGASFVVLGLGLARLGPALGLDTETVAQGAALVMAGFGAVLLMPALNTGFARATAGLAARADAGFGRLDQSGPAGLAAGGALLGAVWVPCIGPTLGGAIALAAAGESLVRAGAIMAAFAAGVGAVMLALAHGARGALMRRQDLMRRLSRRAKPVLGVVFIFVGLAIWSGLFSTVDAWLLDRLPVWFQDLSILI